MLEAVSHLRPGRSGPVRDRSCSSSDCCAAWWLRGTWWSVGLEYCPATSVSSMRSSRVRMRPQARCSASSR